MTKFLVYLAAVASTTVEVQAEDGDEAVEKALSGHLPSTSAFAGYDLGQWSTPSELFPAHNKPEHDYDEVDS